MKIKEELAIIRTKMAYMEKMMYIVIAVVLAEMGVRAI